MTTLKGIQHLIRKMQLKTTLRFYVTPLRMVIIKKSDDNKFRQDMGNGELLDTFGGHTD